MSLLESLLRLTSFKSPLLQTLVPSVGAAFAIQTAFAIPSVIAQSERFYDVSGSLTYLSVVALSLYLPALRSRYAARLVSGTSSGPLPSLLSPFLSNGGAAAFNWRQVVLSGAVAVWAIRLGSYLFQRIRADGTDSRFDRLRTRPVPFLFAWMMQATWVSLVSLPVVALNAVPAGVLSSALHGVRLTDLLGLGLFAGGLALEVAADRQKARWVREKKAKVHDEQFITSGLWSRCRYPNYFGEATLWTGIATAAAGALASPAVLIALGFTGGVTSQLAALSMAYVSPAFTAFLLLKVSGVPMSEAKYDKRYGDRKDYQEWKKNTPLFFPKLF